VTDACRIYLTSRVPDELPAGAGVVVAVVDGESNALPGMAIDRS
jgi:hypothetical protein